MDDEQTDDKPKTNQGGDTKFKPGNQAAKGSGRGGKRKNKGISAEVRRHKKLIVDGLLELATKGTDTARARILSDLTRIGWGAPASAAEMGAVDRVDTPTPTTASGASISQADWDRLELHERHAIRFLILKAAGQPTGGDSLFALIARQHSALSTPPMPYIDLAGNLVRETPAETPAAATAPEAATQPASSPRASQVSADWMAQLPSEERAELERLKAKNPPPDPVDAERRHSDEQGVFAPKGPGGGNIVEFPIQPAMRGPQWWK
jgi:hypothetical protein